MNKRMKDLAWKAFEKSGNTGVFMLYSALTKIDGEKHE